MIPTFMQLKKNLKKLKSENAVNYKMAVIGDFATQHLATALKGYGLELGIDLDILDADYNQIDAQLLDNNSEVYSFKPNAVLLCMCSEKLFETYCSYPIERRNDFANDIYSKIENYWSQINENLKANIIQFNFVDYNDNVFGNYGLKNNSSFHNQCIKLNYLLNEGCQKFKNVYLTDVNNLQSIMGRSKFHDDKLYYIAKMPISLEALPYVAKSVLDIILVLLGKIKKCIILDLDNTLWGGVIGDDGLEGIQIGELGLGHAFSEFQMWLKELKNRGVILAVCSKNNEDTAKEPFEKHPEMILHLEDISMFVANWEDKASNIMNIQKTLNIGMDSIVFIDDNKFERELVRSMIKDITVPELPENPENYLSFLKNENLFETISYSDEDANRTKLYQAEIGRLQDQQKFSSYDDYLKNLEMKAVVAPFDSFHYPRIAQLTQRSNQFNFRTIRYTEADIENIAKDDKYITLYFKLRDKYGEHGLISVVILEKQNDSLFINEWLMSCRVLKRGMEEFIMDSIINVAKQNGFKTVIGEYIPTKKNAMVKDLYAKLGFDVKSENIYSTTIDGYNMHNTYIEMEDK